MASMRFGSSTLDAMSSAMKPITEQFFWGFFTQDVIALWIPRVWRSLIRGRDRYDPSTDPDIGNRGTLEQFFHAIGKNLEGLNWKNAREETYREVETGPVLLATPSIIMGMASILAWGKLAIMMTHDNLKTFTAGLDNLVNRIISNGQNSPATLNRLFDPKLSPQKASQQLMQVYIKDMLFNGHFKDGLGHLLSIKPEEYMTRAERDVKDFILAQFKHDPKVNLKTATYENVLEKWISAYCHLDKKQPFYKVAAQRKEMENLFVSILARFNDYHVLGKNAANGNIASALSEIRQADALNKMEIFIRDLPGELAGSTKTSVHEFLENLRKFTPFVEDLHRVVSAKTSKLPAATWLEKLPATFKSASKSLLQKTLVNKAGLGLFSTLITGAAMIMISSIAQSGKAYHANRLVQLKSLDDHRSSTPLSRSLPMADLDMSKHAKPAAAKHARPMHQPMMHQTSNPTYSRQYQQPAQKPAAVPFNNNYNPAFSMMRGGV